MIGRVLWFIAQARSSKLTADKLGIKAASVTYDSLGPLLNTLFAQLYSNYRQQLIAFGLLFAGLIMQFAGAYR